MESPTPTPAGAPAKLSPAQEAARLRRERREAKIKAGGASRLQAITTLNGGNAPSVPPPSQPAAAATPPPSRPQPASVHDDPDEVDISQHYYTPQTQPRLPPSRSNQPSPFGGFNGTDTPPFPPPGGNPNEDPMMAMLQQMMGGGGGDPNNPQMPPGMPPGLAQMFGGMGQSEAAPPASSSAYLWRIVHAVFSLGLALYITVTTAFTGSKLSRTQVAQPSSWADDEGTPAATTLMHFFYAFATFEVVMQSSRYFLERGRLPPSGLLGSVAQILPEPYAGYVRVVGRYSVIWRTVVADAMVVVFVLGASAWWRGGVVS